MNLESIRAFCLSLPHASEDIQWGDHLLFRVAGKMFAITSLDAGSPTRMSFKCTDESFAELIEREGVIPAPYMARNKWVALTDENALEPAELRNCLRSSYELVVAKLPKKTRDALQGAALKKPKPKRASKQSGKSKKDPRRSA